VLIFTNAVAGSEAEFNDWYETTHVDDVLATAGFHAGQRFGLELVAGLPMPNTHLAIYETQGESPQEVVHRLNETRVNRVISDTMDASQFAIWVFTPLGERHVL